MKTLLTATFAAAAILIAAVSHASTPEEEMQRAELVVNPTFVQEHELQKNLERWGILDQGFIVAWWHCEEYPGIMLVVGYNSIATVKTENLDTAVASYQKMGVVKKGGGLLVFQNDEEDGINYLAIREPVFYAIGYTNADPYETWRFFLEPLIPEKMKILGGAKIVPRNPQ